MHLDFAGWSLTEAVRCTSGSEGADANESTLLSIFERGQLVAFGRRARSGREPIPAAFWNPAIKLDFVNSSASGPSEGHHVSDLLIYPALHAPNVVELLDGLSLKEAFRRFVLHDPEVQFLGNRATKVEPALEHVYVHGWCRPFSCREWPVVFADGHLAGGRPLQSPIGHGADPLPEEVQQAADVVCRRYCALLTTLRKNELHAVGDPARSRGPEQILPSLWSHRSYYIDMQNGDLVQLTSADPVWPFTVRWRAVMLKRPFHVKPTIPHALRSSTVEQLSAVVMPRKAVPRVKTSINARNECRDWLMEIMLASSNKRTENKRDLWEVARKKWPGKLSKRSFDDARTEAIRVTKAYVWSAAGAPKKSQR
jgi:hypothetical protein